MSVDVALQRALGPAMIFGDAEIVSVEFGEAKIERKPGIKKSLKVLAVVTGKDEREKEYEEEYDAPLSYEVTSCPLCAKKGTSYYEGILQIRNETAPVREMIKTYLRTHKDRGLRLAKQVPVASGSDYYLSSQRLVGHLAKQLHAAFGGELKVSAQHFSYDHAAGKNLYRVNAYLEIPEFSKGDVIHKDDHYYFVLGVSTKVKAENLASGMRESFGYEKGVAVRLPIKTTQVTSVSPLMVLHPTTFQAVTPTNSKYAPAEIDIDDEVSVALDEQYLFLIPHTVARAEIKKRSKRHSQKRKTKDDDLVNED
jgi:NMD protein affecting ribosome stability and mRNA decay